MAPDASFGVVDANPADARAPDAGHDASAARCRDGLRESGEICLPLAPADPLWNFGNHGAFGAAGDFDGDGLLDIASGGATWGVHWGGVDTQWLVDEIHEEPGRIMAAVDMDRDGRDELIVIVDQVVDNLRFYTVEIWRVGRGVGRFRVDREVVPSVDPPAPPRVVLADLDGDGDLDVLVGERDYGMRALYRNDDGQLVLAEELEFKVRQVHDVDGDGDLDLVCWTGSYAEVAWNEGDGSFLTSTPFELDAIRALNVLDIDGDGARELVATSVSQQRLEVLVPDADEGFVSFASFPLPAVSWDDALLVTEIDGASGEEIVMQSIDADGLMPLITFGNGGEPIMATLPFVGRPFDVADLDADGRDDLLINETAAFGRIRIMWGGLLGRADTAAPLAVDGLGGVATVVDLDNDGLDDVITEGVTWRLRTGEGTFTEPQTLAAPGAPLITGDFDGDGDQDVAVASFPLRLVLGDGSGNLTLGPQAAVGVPFSPEVLASADLDGDGTDEIIAAGAELGGFGSAVHVFARSGGGWASTGSLAIAGLAMGGGPSAMVVTDIDLDGALEAVIGTTDGTLLVVGLGAPLTLEHALAVEALPDTPIPVTQLVAHNVDGDACVEMFVAASGVLFTVECAVSTLLAPAYVETRDAVESLVFADLDSNGVVELITHETFFGVLAVLDLAGEGRVTLRARYAAPDLIMPPQAMDGATHLMWSTSGGVEVLFPAP